MKKSKPVKQQVLTSFEQDSIKNLIGDLKTLALDVPQYKESVTAISDCIKRITEKDDHALVRYLLSTLRLYGCNNERALRILNLTILEVAEIKR